MVVMKPQHMASSHVEAPDGCVEIPAGLDARTVHVLLTRVHYGSLGWHRAGYVTADDGLDPAPQLMPWLLTICEEAGLVAREDCERGDKFILPTATGRALLARLDAELFGGAE